MVYDFNKIKKHVIASGIIPFGFLGHDAVVDFAFLPETKTIVAVTPILCFRSGLPDAETKEEAIWLLKNHSSSPVVRRSLQEK